jgi:hypothetical protein
MIISLFMNGTPEIDGIRPAPCERAQPGGARQPPGQPARDEHEQQKRHHP